MIDFSRREAFLTAAAATTLAAAGSAAVQPAMAQAPAAAGQAPGFYRYKVGDITVTAIHDGSAPRALEGFVRNAELSAVQAAAAAAFLPTNAIQNTFTSLVVQNGNDVTLLDAGLGEFGPPTTGQWMGNFRAAGFTPQQVNRIVISHFHGDHIGGIRKRDGSLTFANAQIMVPEPEWAFWMDDARMAAAPETGRAGFQNARRVFAPIAANVTRYAPGSEIAPGISSMPAFGHSPGHTVFLVSSGMGKLLFLADTASHPALFVRNPDWSAIFDMDADAARATRRRLLDMAATDKTQVHFYHAPFPATGFIARDGNGFEMVPAQWSSAI
jgi:glyoxylase-like metal-dependent hydrolase (beta-lactamase superfamily II)